MIWFCSILLFIYVVAIALCIIGWARTVPVNKKSGTNSASIAIVIPFRNEENHLASTIESILNQKFSGDFEIILVNDHSEDSSSQIAKNYAEEHTRIYLYQLVDQTGKKQALNFGIKKSNSQIILQCDADCTHNSSWLNTMYDNFSADCKLLLGPVKIENNKCTWNWMNELEMMFLQTITASTLYFGIPTMANGANLMYRKEDYFKYKESGIGSNYSSGDDQHLLNYLAKKDAKSIKYCKDKNTIATTAAIAAGRYSYDLVLDSGAEVTRILEGKFIVTGAVTT